MKNIAFIILYIISCTSNLYSQYDKFLVRGNEWHVYHFFEASHNNIESINGDSIINGQLYSKFLYSQYGAPNDQFVAWLREDTINKQIYRWTGNSTEKIIYDFSLSPGDTFHYNQTTLILDSITNKLPVNLCPSYNSNSNPVLDIDDPKIFYFSSTWGGNWFSNPVIWIEGIGSLAGPMLIDFPWKCGDLGETLLCHFNSSKQREFHYYIYNEENIDCQGPILSINNPINTNIISISPNPTSSQVYIENKSVIKKILIYNSAGKHESTFEINSTSHNLSLAKNSNGILYIVIELDNGQYSTMKIVKL